MSSGLLRKYLDLFEQDKPFRVEVVDGPNIAFIGDSIAFGLSSKMMTGTVRDAAVGLSSSAVANRVARNKNVQNAITAVISAGTNDFATGRGDAAALESNLSAIRSALKAQNYTWLGPYNPEANAVVKKYAKSQGDNFVDLNRYPADSLGMHPRDYTAIISDLQRSNSLPVTSTRDKLDKDPTPGPFDNSAPSDKPSASTMPSPSPSPSSQKPETDSEKTQPPSDISQYKAKVRKTEQDFKSTFKRELPITSRERTRAQQQDLYDRWRRGEKGIYMPVNPANHPGREIFHNTAIDVSPALSRDEEAWMNQQGWVRPMPTDDPVHYEYRGKWDEPASSPAAAAKPDANKDNKDNTVTPQGRPDLDKLGQILRKKVKESNDLLKNVDQLSPQQQMQIWQAVLVNEAEATRVEPTFDPDKIGSADKLAQQYQQQLASSPTEKKQPKLVKDGKGWALVAADGQRFGGFATPRAAAEWAAKPENAKMLYPVKRDLNLKPLGGTDKFKQTMKTPKAKSVGKWSSILAVGGAGANYAYNALRSQDLSDYSDEDQQYIKKMLPMMKDYYNNVDKFQSELDRDQQLQVVNYINTLKKLPALKSDFPANAQWDAYVKTIN